jgi:PIN domain nuclease of toxin-antitoxin system
MIILDTCALIFDALFPERLTENAINTIEKSEQQSKLFCCDISLWEVAMLIQKKRLNPEIETQFFLETILKSRRIQLLSINPEIAAISCSENMFKHKDPADRLIAATTIHHRAKLVTSDTKLVDISGLEIIW